MKINRKVSVALLLVLLCQTLLSGAASIADAASSQITKYRVYQNDNALKEFPTETQAIAYAKKFGYSHVETISGRNWIWDNYPRYKIYQNGVSNAKWEFRTYESALAVAKNLSNAYIRDLENIGWKYETYDKYRLYQGEKTQASWSFQTLDAAKKEAKKWGNAHIIELSTNKWIWDNLTAAQKKAQQSGTAVYQLFVDGAPVQEDKLYSFLGDAIDASTALKGSTVVHTVTGKIVFSNEPSYIVQQNGSELDAFISLNAAVQLAKKTPHAEVIHNGAVLWSGIPYLAVYQQDNKLRSFNTIKGAIAYAKGYANSSIRNTDGRIMWSNMKSLVYLAWNGSATSSTILSHVANTQGLSIDSPTWFELGAADGTLKDTSDKAVVDSLKSLGIKVVPLVHNQFNKSMTTAFLKDSAAQKTFINKLVTRLAELEVDGVNLDFESIAGSDRKAYTSFVTELTKAVHAKGLEISIDLPRGSTSWNHQTAYDHEALAEIVDTIIIMAYDEHWSGSTTPGSVAGLAWAEEGVKQFLSYGIPRSKLMLGIPFYVREWKLDSSGKMVSNRAVFMKEVPALIESTNAKGVLDPESGQMKYTYVKDGYTYMFWAETEETVKARINIAKAYDLAGVAAWRLGYESSDLWTMMLRMK